MSQQNDPRPWLAGYFHEPAVWPITVVLLAHGVLGLAVALLDALRRHLLSLWVLGALLDWGAARAEIY